MAILTPSADADRFSLFAAAAVTGSNQFSGAVPMSAAPQMMLEITTDGNNNADMQFWLEGTNDPTVAAGSSGWIPAEPLLDMANTSASGDDIKVYSRRLVHLLASGVAAMSHPMPNGWLYLRLGIKSGNTNGLLTAAIQRARGNG